MALELRRGRAFILLLGGNFSPGVSYKYEQIGRTTFSSEQILSILCFVNNSI